MVLRCILQTRGNTRQISCCCVWIRATRRNLSGLDAVVSDGIGHFARKAALIILQDYWVLLRELKDIVLGSCIDRSEVFLVDLRVTIFEGVGQSVARMFVFGD